MKTKLHLLLLLLLPFMAIAQKTPRTILHGKVVADSLKVENLTVQNLNSKIRAVTDANGEFTLYARPTDTLLFSGVTVREALLNLRPEHFKVNQLLIKLDVDVTMLNEVVITAHVLTGVLESDSKKAKTKNITGGMNSAAIIENDTVIRTTVNPNSSLPSNVIGSPLTGVDFAKIYKLIFKKRRRTDSGQIYGAADSKSFSENVKGRFTHHFFVEMLKIPNEEIGLFLAYCDKGKETLPLLDPKKEFELTDYLVSQSREYLKKEK